VQVTLKIDLDDVAVAALSALYDPSVDSDGGYEVDDELRAAKVVSVVMGVSIMPMIKGIRDAYECGTMAQM
jgi:hypothetical protein